MCKILLFPALTLALFAADRGLVSDSPPVSIAFSKDGKSISARCRDGHIRSWDLSSGKLASDKTYSPRATMLSEELLLDSDADGKTMKVWDLTSERQLQLLNGAPVRMAAVSADRKYIATSNPAERTVRVWDLATGKENHNLPDGLGGASGLVFSPDGETIVSANYDNDIRVWKTRSGELVRKVEDMTGAMFAAAFTPDGKELVMAGLDETVYVWEAKSFSLKRKLKGHGETIASLAVSPDGRTLVTGGFDVITLQNPVKLAIWDLAAGKITKVIRAPHRVVSLKFSPDGKWVAFLTGDKEISMLDLTASR